MAVTTGMLMAMSTAISVAGSVAQGRAASKAADADAQMLENQAAAQKDQAEMEADRIRRAGRRTAGAARAQMAASGVRVDDGSAVLIDEEITGSAERDAQMTLLTGRRQESASRYAADMARASGSNAMTASILGGVSTGLQGWKGVKQDAGYRYKVPTYDGAEY